LAAVTLTSWTSAASGDWVFPNRWSIAPQVPNNGSPTVSDTYSVHIDASGAAYTVGVGNTSITVDRVSLGGSGTLYQENSSTVMRFGTFSIGGSGQYQLKLGTLADSTLNVSGSGRATTFPQGGNSVYFNNVYATGTLNVSSGTLQMTGGALDQATVYIGDTIHTSATLDLSPTTMLIAPHFILRPPAGGTVARLLSSTGDLVFPAGTIIERDSNCSMSLGVSGRSIVNNGTILSSFQLGSLSSSAALTNNGTILIGVSNASLDPGWNNAAGTIEFKSTLELRGTFTPDRIGTIKRTATFTTLNAGTINNAGNTLDVFTAFGGSGITTFQMINGGTIMSSGTADIRMNPIGTLTAVTVGAGANVLVPGPCDVSNGLSVLAGGTVTISGSNAQLTATNTQTFGGGGRIRMFGLGTLATSLSTLTLGPGLTLESASSSNYFRGSIVNQGTILAVGGSFVIDRNGSPPFANQGTVIVNSGQTFRVDFSDTFTNRIGNFINGTFTGGSWVVHDSGSISLNSSFVTRNIRTNDADVTLDGPLSQFASINTLDTNLGTFTVTGGRKFTTAGTLTNSGTVRVGGGGSALKVTAPLTNTGTIDVSGALLVDYAPADASPLPTIQSQIAFARHDGLWDRAGISSSAARAASPPITTLGAIEGSDYIAATGTTTFAGLPVDSSAALVKYTYYGDANLSGAIDFDDYVRIDVGFNTQLTGWFNGDFNYSGAVNFDDYVLIDIAFNTQSGTLGRAVDYLSGEDRGAPGLDDAAVATVVNHFQQFGSTYAANFLAAVPEPASMAIAAAACGLARRRRR
jgi:hypothetical protein